MAAILSQIVNLLKENPREHLQEEADGTEGTQVEADEAESALEGISAAQQAAKGLTTMCLPAITDVLAAQQHDAVTQSYRACSDVPTPLPMPGRPSGMGRHTQTHSTSRLHVERTANIVQANVQTVQGVHLGMAERLHQRPGDHLVRIYANHREPDSR
jgi:hypothetical protein